jgi:hypothetical protein
MSKENQEANLLEFALAVERWAHGEGIDLCPSLMKRIEAIRKQSEDVDDA